MKIFSIFIFLFSLIASSNDVTELARVSELINAHETIEFSSSNRPTLEPLFEITKEVLQNRNDLSQNDKRKLGFLNEHLGNFLSVNESLANCGDQDDSRGLGLAANLSAANVATCASFQSQSLPGNSFFSQLDQGSKDLRETLARETLNQELTDQTLEDSLKSKLNTANLFPFLEETKDSICQEAIERFSSSSTSLKEICTKSATQESFASASRVLEVMSAKAGKINEKLAIVRSELNQKLNEYRRENPRSNVRHWRELVLEVGPTLPSYLEYLAEYDKQTSDSLGRLILVEPMDKKFGKPFQFDNSSTPNPLGNASGGVTFTPPIHASRNYTFSPTPNKVDITEEDITETLENLKESSSEAFDRIERAKRERDPVEKTVLLLKANPYSLGTVLMRNPFLGKISCSSIALVKSRDRRREVLFKTVDYVALGIGVIPVFGWGASLATKAGSLALRGLSTTARLASSRAVGAVVALSTGGEVLNIGQKLSHYSEIMNTLEFTLIQGPEASDEVIKQYKNARSELDQAILEAKLTGAFLGFSSAFVARNLVVSTRGLSPAKVIESIQLKAAEIRALSTGGRRANPSHLAARAPLSPSQINHQVYGDLNDGRPTLFLVHGRDDSMTSFRKNIELSDEFNIVTLDLRGFGGSARGSMEELNLSTMAGDIKVLMDSLGVDNAHFVAHSMGARVSARFKELYPDRMRSLIAEDMGMHVRAPMANNELNDVLENARRLSSRTRYQSKDEVALALREVGYDEKTSNFLASRLSVENSDGTLSLQNIEPGSSYLFTRLSGAENLLPGLRQHSDMPMLFMRADPNLSSSFTDEGVRLINEALPEVRVQDFPGARHSIHSSQPDAYNDSVRSFIRSIEN